MPVLLRAISLASSRTSGGAPRLSTTTIASVVVPSSSTSARACSGSWAPVAMFALKPPGMFSGNSSGVTSTAAAPARSVPSAPAANGGMAVKNKAQHKVTYECFMVASQGVGRLGGCRWVRGDGLSRILHAFIAAYKENNATIQHRQAEVVGQ